MQPIVSHFLRCLDLLYSIQCLHTHSDCDFDRVYLVFVLFCQL